MSHNPYRSLPPYAFWRRSVAEVPSSEVDPVVAGKFRIGRADKVATAGSCFAQHIARHLRSSGFNYFVTEPGHPVLETHVHEAFNYGVFSARYGNLYTSRQLLQLLHRAYGLFTPQDDVWLGENGRVIDPYRPQIQPGGFSSIAEYCHDRRQHFAAIRRAIEEMDVFVFTLGLTETWLNRIDGAAYPLCPGVAGGEFDPSLHEFVNLGVDEVVADMQTAIAFIREKNATARIILTVSPVPLIATMEPRSALVSTTYSKSVLRVAAEQLASGDPGIAYFPSFEIITGNFNRGSYFAEDLRSVTETGVSHVMRLFMKHYTDNASTAPLTPPEDAADLRFRKNIVAAQEAVKVICDEEMLDSRNTDPPEEALSDLVARAHTATRAHDFDLAAQLWRKVLDREPDNAQAYILGGMSLHLMGHLDAADALLRAGVERFPRNEYVLAQLAEVALKRGDWQETARMTATLRTTFPHIPDGFVLCAHMLRSQKHYDAADRMLSDAVRRFPKNASLREFHCNMAMVREDWATAVKRWAEFRDDFPERSAGNTGSAIALSKLSETERAATQQTAAN